jgi:hypothetical protein
LRSLGETPRRPSPGSGTPRRLLAVFALAYGARNDIRHPFFAGIAASLVEAGVSVLRFDFPYASRGRGYPDRPPVLLSAWRAALEEAVRRADGRPVVAGGKSLGGRMARTVTPQHSLGREVPKHAIERIRVGAHRLGQLRRRSQPSGDVVVDPQGGCDPYRHRGHQVRHRPQSRAPLTLVCHHAFFASCDQYRGRANSIESR